MTVSSPALVPDAPPPAPRAITPRISMRSWMDPRPRFWLIVAAFLLALVVYFSIARILEWRQEADLVRHGTVVTATVGVGGVSRSGYVIPAGTPVQLSFKFNGQDQQVEGLLEGQPGLVATGKTIQIRVDANDPAHWTDLSEPTPLLGNLIGPLLILPIVPIAFLLGWLKRRKLLAAWTSGAAEAAVVNERHQTALAPLSHVILCSFRDLPDKRLIQVYLPRAFSKIQPGDVIWLLTSPKKGGPAIAAAWLE